MKLDEKVASAMMVIEHALFFSMENGEIDEAAYEGAIDFMNAAGFPESHEVGSFTIERILTSQSYRAYQTKHGPGAFFLIGELSVILKGLNERLNREKSPLRVRASRSGEIIVENIKPALRRSCDILSKKESYESKDIRVKLFN